MIVEGILNSDLSRIIDAFSGQYIVRILPPFMNNVSSAINGTRLCPPITVVFSLSILGD